MAQTKAFEWYKYEQPVAMPGMKADASVDVVDSVCAEVAMNPGDVVKRGSADGLGKPILTSADLGTAISILGIAVHTQKDYDGEGAYYKVGDAVPVMSFGDVYVEAGATVAAGAAAGLATTDSKAELVNAADLGTGVALTGMTFLASGVDGDIVPLRIRK